jgi:hypothetical protein
MSDAYDEWRRDPLKWEACNRLEKLGAAIGPIDEKTVHVEFHPPFEGMPIQDDDIPGIVHDVNLLGNVATLDVSEAPITDQGMKHLGLLRNLRELHLIGTKITDDGVKFLVAIPRLNALTLSGTEVSDGSISYLIKMKSLQFLQLYGTKISPKGIAKLKKAFPRMRIER